MEEARHLLSGLEDTLNRSETPHYCQNYIINSVLSYYLNIAQEEGVQVHSIFMAPPKNAIDSVSFSVVLANALENALHAFTFPVNFRQEDGMFILQMITNTAVR